MRTLAPVALALAALLTTGCPSSNNPPAGLDAATVVPPGPDASAPVCDHPLCGTACCKATEICDSATTTCKTCVPSCPSGAQCGDDGCGGSCGTCTGTSHTCVGHTCQTCPYVGCNGVCCTQGQVCDPSTNQCASCSPPCTAGQACDPATKKCVACTPDCAGKSCGDNGCGGVCPPGCTDVFEMCKNDKCVGCTAPDGGSAWAWNPKMCQRADGTHMDCGPDSITGCSCGGCNSDESCVSGACTFCSRPLCGGACCAATETCDSASQTCKACVPSCNGKVCGDDGCGGSCGSCAKGQACKAGSCSTCTPSCGTRLCGADKNGCICDVCTGQTTCIQGLCEPCSRPLCGGVCCALGTTCDATSHCVRCTPDCTNKVCGDDGCGGSCGPCTAGTRCANGACQACTPDCANKDCGGDDCNGQCGSPCDFTNQGLLCQPRPPDGGVPGMTCLPCANPEQFSDICARLQAQCGSPVVLDSCGQSGSVDCTADGGCTNGNVCDPKTFNCVPPCVTETDSDFCKRIGRACGQASGTDNCGSPRFVQSCGTCTTGICSGGVCQ